MNLLTVSGGHWQVPPAPLLTQGLVAVLQGSPDQCSKSWHLVAVPPTLGGSNACSWSCSIPTLSFHGIPTDLSIAAASLSVPGLQHHPCSLPALLPGCCGMMLSWEGPSLLAPGLADLTPQLLPYTCLGFPEHIHKWVQGKITILLKLGKAPQLKL